jgi:hypothetical protein
MCIRPKPLSRLRTVYGRRDASAHKPHIGIAGRREQLDAIGGHHSD